MNRYQSDTVRGAVWGFGAALFLCFSTFHLMNAAGVINSELAWGTFQGAMACVFVYLAVWEARHRPG